MRWLGGILLVALLGVPPPSTAAPDLSDVLRFLSWETSLPPPLERALLRLERGEPSALLDVARDLRQSEHLADEGYFLATLALVDLGRPREAAAELAALPEASPYRPLALLEVVEELHREGAFREVADLAATGLDPLLSGRGRATLVAFGDVVDEDGWRNRELPATDERRARAFGPFERPAERLVYLAGTDCLRVGDFGHARSLLARLGPASPYRPWALHAAAQAALGRGDHEDARRLLDELHRYHPVTLAEQRLRSRSHLLGSFLRLEGNGLSSGLREAERSSDPWGSFLQASAALAADEPALAVAYYGAIDEASLPVDEAAERALGLAAARIGLGDPGKAAAVLARVADRLRTEQAWLATPEARSALRAALGRRVREELRWRATIRRRTASGMRRLVALEGPWNLGKVARLLVTPHRHTVFGERPVDLSLLAVREVVPRTPPLPIPAGKGILRSTERVLARAIEMGRDPGERRGPDTTPRVSALRHDWIPASAGMTEGRHHGIFRHPGESRGPDLASRSDSATNGSVEAGVGEILDRRRAHLGELERRLEEARGEALDAARRQLSSVARNGPSLAP